MNHIRAVRIPIASVRPHLVLRSITAMGIFFFGGCSWFMPHPEKSGNIIGDADTPHDGRCSLAVAQDRKSLFTQIIADGIAKPLIIHAQSVSARDREIRNGHSIFFEASTRDADPARNFEPGTIQGQASDQPMTQAALWRIYSVDAPVNAIAEDVVIVDRTVVELREIDGSPNLQSETKAASGDAQRASMSLFILYKADVPDPTRPTTCDAQIRDEDFVFVRALAPSMWVSIDPRGILEIPKVPAANTAAPLRTTRNPQCAYEEERCHTDPRGGLVCAWAPACGE